MTTEIEKLIEGNWDKRKEAFERARENKETPIEVNCLGSKDFKIGSKQTFIRVSIKRSDGGWQDYDGMEYEDLCPVCLKLMLVRAIRGSTWLACCSKECYEKYADYQKSFESRYAPKTLTKQRFPKGVDQ